MISEIMIIVELAPKRKSVSTHQLIARTIPIVCAKYHRHTIDTIDISCREYEIAARELLDKIEKEYKKKMFTNMIGARLSNWSYVFIPLSETADELRRLADEMDRS